MESEGGNWGLERLDGLYEAQLGGEPKGYWVLLPHVPKEWVGGWVSSDLREGRKSRKAEGKDRAHPTPDPLTPVLHPSLFPCLLSFCR